MLCSTQSLLALAKRARSLAFLLAALLCASVPASAVETVLLDDSFTDLDRANAALPVSGRYHYLGAGPANDYLGTVPVVIGRELVVKSTGSATMINGYFTPAGGARVLEVGDSLTATFSLALSATPNADAGLRIGLYNSNGARPAADVAASAIVDSATYGGYAGYGIYFNPVGATSNTINFNLVRKVAADNFGIPTVTSGGANGPILNFGANTKPALSLATNVAFPVTLTISRTSAAQVTITANINGTTTTVVDGSGAFITAFDTLTLFHSSAAVPNGQTLKIDDVAITYGAAGGGAQTLLNDSFADSDRTTQALPASAAWFLRIQNVAAVPANVLSVPSVGTANPNIDLVLRTTPTPSTTITYFKDTPQELADGESLLVRLSTKVSVRSDVPRGLRLGLFNSGGNRITADYEDGAAGPAGVFTGYQGYTAEINTGGTAAGGVTVHKRNAAEALFDSAAFTELGADGVGPSAFAPLDWTRVTLRLTRIGATMRVEALVHEVWVTVSDVAPATFAFDTLALHVPSGGLPGASLVRIDDVLVLHNTTTFANVTSPATIVSENFNRAGWSTAHFAGEVPGSVTYGETGSYDGLGAVTPSGALRLNADGGGAGGVWSAALKSGVLAVSNAETQLGLLTLAFDLKASSTRPVLAGIESLDADGAVTGRLERWVYPVATTWLQRFSFELADMTPAGGSFDPTSGRLQLSWKVEGGGTAPFSWADAPLTLDVDNVHLARPRYYVSPTGNNANPGTFDAPFATMSRAAALSNPGDIILIRSGSGEAPHYVISTDSNNQGVQINRAGTPAAWITFKAYPGESPVIQNAGWSVLRVGAGSNGGRDRVASVGYIELRGLALRGVALTLPDNLKGSPTNGSANTTGVTIEGRYMAKRPHHVRVVDLDIRNCSGGGGGPLQGDFVSFEGCYIRDNCYWTAYAPSGCGTLDGFNYAGRPDEIRQVFLGNQVIHNQATQIWVQVNAISDGNGIIIDTNMNTAGNNTEGPYSGRTLVQGNLTAFNGGSGMHAYLSRRVSVVNNTSYQNNQILNYGELWSNQCDDIQFHNNILVSAPASAGRLTVPKQINPVVVSGTRPIVVGVNFHNNVYQVGTGSLAPSARPGDSGNVTTAAALFVNAAGEDFRLLGQNPAVDRGTINPVTGLIDVLGYPRAADGVIDAGAFERQPILLGQPLSTSVVAGTTLTLRVNAVGDDLTYQWFYNGAAINDATAATLEIGAATLGNEGGYHVVVSSAGNSVTSATSVVDVKVAATISTPPASKSVTVGDEVAFSVVAEGDGPLVYQWRKDGSPIAGATAPTYVLSRVVTAAAGTYDVVVTNPVNTVISSPATLTVTKAAAGLALQELVGSYDGTPRTVKATTSPADLAVAITYNGSATPPVYPGDYAVMATVVDDDYAAAISGTLRVTITAIVRHAPVLNGDTEGSLQVLQPESLALNSGALVSGDLLVPGTPKLVRNGGSTVLVGTRTGPGASAPSNHTITLNGDATLRYLVRGVDALTLPAVATPPAPGGTRDVVINSSAGSAGNFATLRNLTLNSGAGQLAIPPGTYGTFTANGASAFTLGIAGATTPAVYNLQKLTLNSSSPLRVIGPVVLNLAQGISFNSDAGDPEHPAWLVLNVSAGGVTLNTDADLHARVAAPSGAVTINRGTLTGRVVSDRLVINQGGLLKEAP